jgi:hypothetical protein
MPIKPASLALTVKEKQDDARSWSERTESDIPDYPWGTVLTLEHEELQKLGYSRGQLEAGDTVELAGKAMVVSVDAKQVNGGVQYSARLQVTDLGIEKQEDQPAPATILFGG